MVAGQSNKIGFIIQARMESTRLPGKILLPLPLANGKPLLSWIIDELRQSKYDHKIIVATSVNTENDVVESFCHSNGVNCFRGSEDDVLSRFTTIAQQENFDCIVRLTADNPIIDIALLDETIAFHLESANDYTKTDDLPVGMNFEIISPDALLSQQNETLSTTDKEHVTAYVRNHDEYKKSVYCPNVNPAFKELRLTVDYVSDYTVLATILSQYEPHRKGIELVDYCFNNYRWIFEGNAANFQKKQYNNIDEEINAAAVLLERSDLKNAAEVLKKNSQS
jgi:spore coat polysaccharide biosynthesis protein SpsF